MIGVSTAVNTKTAASIFKAKFHPEAGGKGYL
jgi:hypothetical protein